MNPVELKVFWNRLIGLANEQGRALKRTAFSPVVTQTGDMSVSICNARGELIANAETGAPGHMNTIGNTVDAILKKFGAENLFPEDILVTNDPWSGSGHLFDVSVIMPIFNAKGTLIAFFGTNIHYTDIGGVGIGVSGRDVHEEGLWIPELKLYDRGKPNEAIFEIIRHNVRTPKWVIGDLLGQVSCARKGSEELLKLCRSHGISDLVEVGDRILQLSETSMRKAIRALNSGTYHGQTTFDILGGEGKDYIVELKVALIVDSERGEITADFTGSSPPSRFGINVVAGYSHAYTRFAVQCCLNPELPNNSGSHKPIKFVVSKASILNAQYPSPVGGRHLVGQNLPFAIMNALYAVAPDNILAESVGGSWGVQLNGQYPDGRHFSTSNITFRGGFGARATKRGLDTTPFPTGNARIPLEVIEATTPLVFERREIAIGTGGRGKHDGGDAETAKFYLRTPYPWYMSAITTKSKQPPRGVGGGGDASPGWFKINGQLSVTDTKLYMQPDDTVELQLPGGAAYGAPD